MSEKIFAFLLRLYPVQFRRQYGAEFLQLMRDRLRDEAETMPRFRLWFDLITDFFFGVPQAYRNSYAMSVAAPMPQHVSGLPAFRSLDQEPLRPSSLALGSVISFIAIVAFAFVMKYGGTHPIIAPDHDPSSIESVMKRLNQPATVGNTPSDAPDRLVIGNHASQSHTAPAQQQEERATYPNPLVNAVETGRAELAERYQVVRAVAQDLERYYPDHERAHEAADALRGLAQESRYSKDPESSIFAHHLTGDVRFLLHDPHVFVDYRLNPIPEHTPALSAAAAAQYTDDMHRLNCTFERVAILPHNIGYVKLNSFPDPAVCRAQAESAMERINNADAVIFDLRDNTGGNPAMVELIADRLFDQPVPWYNPRAESDTESMTHSPVTGSRLADKPVYILTSAITISAAEQFAYNLKMLNRAIIVGKTTGGSVHAGVFHRINDHFGIAIPDHPIVNPYQQPDWERIGVEPDAQVRPAEALLVAEKLAATKLARNR